MLLVVFGAGASYDAVPIYPPPEQPGMRLPLANDLFSSRYIGHMSSFPRCLPIIPYLQNQPSGVTVERVLQRLQDEAPSYPERYNQLAAIRYYLQLMISAADLNWCGSAGGITNHLTMLDQIRSVQGNQQVCIITFNYDRIIETVLGQRGITFSALDDYVSNEQYILVKLHGSVNWGREITTPIERTQEKNVWELVREIIDRAHELDISDQYQLVQDRPMGHFNGKALYPAIAIPLETKTDYECPRNHIDCLHTALADVNVIIGVGWRAADLPFVQMLARTLRGSLRTLVVAASEADAQEPIERLSSAGVPGAFIAAKVGFTPTVVNQEIERFLRE